MKRMPRCYACQLVWARQQKDVFYTVGLSEALAKAEANQMTDEEGREFVQKVLRSLKKSDPPVRHRLFAWLLLVSIRACPRTPARMN
jgi:hypothetical protein